MVANAIDDRAAIRAAVDQGLKDLSDIFHIFGVRHADGLDANQFVRFVIENLTTGWRDVPAHKIKVELKHHVSTMLGQETIAGLALFEALLRGDALIDVTADGMNGGHSSV